MPKCLSSLSLANVLWQTLQFVTASLVDIFTSDLRKALIIVNLYRRQLSIHVFFNSTPSSAQVRWSFRCATHAWYRDVTVTCPNVYANINENRNQCCDSAYRNSLNISKCTVNKTLRMMTWHKDAQVLLHYESLKVYWRPRRMNSFYTMS